MVIRTLSGKEKKICTMEKNVNEDVQLSIPEWQVILAVPQEVMYEKKVNMVSFRRNPSGETLN